MTQSTWAIRLNRAPDDDENHALGTLEKADLAARDGVFGASAGVTDEHGACHDNRCQHDIEKAIDGSIIDQEPHQNGKIRITVEDGIEETAEASNAVGFASHAAIDHIEKPGADHRHNRPRETCRPRKGKRPRYLSRGRETSVRSGEREKGQGR